MNDSSITISLPVQFVLDRLIPTPGELVCGYRLGWISPQAAVQLALAGLEVIADPPAVYEDLALLLSDSLDQVPQLMDELSGAAYSEERDAKIWIFLALSWVYENRADLPDPFLVVEQLYADFNYPEEMEGFVRFLPVAEGMPTGVDAMFDRWASYLEVYGEKYRHRFEATNSE
jgi:hypothetical protein